MKPYDKPFVGMFLNNYAFSGRVIGGRINGQTVTFGQHNPHGVDRRRVLQPSIEQEGAS